MDTGSSPLSKRLLRVLAAGLLVLMPVLPAMAQDMLTLEVRARDTLIGISARYLEQPSRWPELQKLNRITNPRRLQPGSSVRIPLDWLRWSELPVQVEFVQGVVTGRQGPLSAGMRLQAGDSLDTGAQGAAGLQAPRVGDAVEALQLGPARGLLKIPCTDTYQRVLRAHVQREHVLRFDRHARQQSQQPCCQQPASAPTPGARAGIHGRRSN